MSKAMMLDEKVHMKLQAKLILYNNLGHEQKRLSLMKEIMDIIWNKFVLLPDAGYLVSEEGYQYIKRGHKSRLILKDVNMSQSAFDLSMKKLDDMFRPLTGKDEK